MAVITVYDPFSSEFYGDAGWVGSGHPSWWDTQANMPPGDGVDVSDAVPYTTAITVKDNVSIAGVNWQAYSIEGEGFSAPFYGDPVFTPTALDFGTVTDEKTITFTVYNPSIIPKMLSILDVTPAVGVTLTPPSALPFVIGALATATFTVVATISGPSSIAGSFTFYIGGDEFDLTFTGIRTLGFQYAMNGAGPLVETISYYTSIARTLNSTETRVGLRSDPKVTLEGTYTVIGSESFFLREDLLGWMTKTFDVSQWQEQTYLAANAAAGQNQIQVETTDLPWQVGRSVVLYGGEGQFEIAYIDAIDTITDLITLTANLGNSWPARTQVFPTLTMRLMSDVSIQEITREVLNLTLNWESDPSSLGVWIPTKTVALTYKGIEVFPFEHNWREGRRTTIIQRSGFMHKEFGGVSVGYQSVDNPFSSEYVITSVSRSQIANMKAFLGRRKGRLNPFYLPSGRKDFTFTDGFEIGTPFLFVEYRPQIALLFSSGNHRNIVVYLKNGTSLMGTIIAVEPGEANDMILTLDANFASTVNLVDLSHASYMYLARLDSDAISITRYTPEVAETTLPCLNLNEEGL
jgi:hypothetical protein